MRNAWQPRNRQELEKLIKAVFHQLKVAKRTNNRIKDDNATAKAICKILEDCDFDCTVDEAINSYMINNQLTPLKSVKNDLTAEEKEKI